MILACLNATAKSITNCAKDDFGTVLKAANSRGRKPHVLVTGAAGFIASHVADYCLSELNFTVVAVDDLSGGFLHNLDVSSLFLALSILQSFFHLI